MLRILGLLMSQSIVLFWLFFELKMISVIIFLSKRAKTTPNPTPPLLYFRVQRLSRIFFWLGFGFSNLRIIQVSLFIKLGLIPFIWWFPFLTFSLKWIQIFLLLTFRKFPRFFVFFYVGVSSLSVLFVLLSVFVGILGMACSLKRVLLLLGWRRIVDRSFILFLSRQNLRFMKFYLVVYTLSVGVWLCCFWGFGLVKLSSSLEYRYNNNKSLFFLRLVVLGLPPFLGFLFKLNFIYVVLRNRYFLMRIFLICAFVLQMFCYLFFLVKSFYKEVRFKGVRFFVCVILRVVVFWGFV